MSKLDQLVADYVRACEAGQSPDREQLVLQNADLTEDLRDFFRHRDRMEALLSPLRSAAARVLNIRCPHCRNSIELVDDVKISSISCPSCGSKFSLIGSSKFGGPVGLDRIGQFQLIEQVGVGQFGVVWKARDMALERTVAIKIPRSRQMSPTDVEVFLRDARVSAHLKHPHIVSVHEVGKHEDAIYIVSDFIQGDSLKDWIATKRPAIRESVQLCATIADALHYAHEAGVVHRDLKPGNIMMDLCGEPHIVDFGLAKHDSGEITMTVEGQILGTPAYMSPEQARGDGHHVDRTADIYSLGVVLFELLTEELPFRGDKQILLTRILNDAPPSPRKLNGKIPHDLETICLKCLEKDPRNRYQSAGGFAEDCRRFVDGKPVSARPVSRIVKGVRWCRRNSIVAGLSAAVVMLLAGISMTTSVGLVRTQRALAVSNERANTIEENLYFSEMSRGGQAALNSGGLTEVRRLIANWRPEKTRVDRRNWEWHYLDSLLHQDIVTLKGHEGGVFALDWSNDGRFLASASADWSIRIWSNDGHVVHNLACHSDAVLDVEWNEDSTKFASASRDGTARIFNADDGTPIATLAHGGPVQIASWSPNGMQLATVSSGDVAHDRDHASVTVWNTETWRRDETFSSPIENASTIVWHPTQSQLAIAPRRGKAVIVDSTNGDIISSVGKDADEIALLDWSHDGTKIAYGKRFNKIIHVWMPATAETTSHPVVGAVSCLAWHPGRSILANADGNKSVQLHDYSEEPIPRKIRGHVSRVTSVCWHPEGKHLATGDIMGNITIWNATEQSAFLGGAASISWHPDGTRYATRIGKSVRVCDLMSGSRTERLAQHKWDIMAVAWSPNGASVASFGYGGVAQIWDVESGTIRCTVQTEHPYFGQRFPRVLAWSPDSRQLAIPDDDRTVRIVNVEDGETVIEISTEFKQLSSIAWSPNGLNLAAGGYDGAVRIWQTRTGTLVNSIGVSDNTTQIKSMCWSPDGASLAVAASQEGVAILDVENEVHIRWLLGHATYVNAVAWSPDGSRVASADESGSVRIWDPITGQQALALEYPGPVPDLAWSPNGKILAATTYGGGKTVRLWDSRADRADSVYW